jgi:NADPH-dependent 2,4-dienoyl-CoA reductase/sulfur reductase-like enzyme
MKRRTLLQATLLAGPLASASLVGCASVAPQPARAQVVVVGGGFGGATAAKYVRLLSDHRIEVVLIEPEEAFVSCPGSNLVLGGSRTLADVTVPYDALTRRHGVVRVPGRAQSIDPQKKTVRLADGTTIGYDKLVLATGVDMMWDSVQGLQAAQAEGRILQAWKAGAETSALRRQLEAMPDGGVYAIAIPLAPFRCLAAPYERASQVAFYFQQAKPRSKVLILDANPDVTSMATLFHRFWAERYANTLEYRPNYRAEAVDARALTVSFETGDMEHADVLNVLPDMRAGALAVQTGLANVNQRWCGVDYLTFESTVAPDIHVVGDSIMSAAVMPKSAHLANAQGKVAAAAIVAQLSGWDVNPQPVLTNACYSHVDDRLAIHVSTVHQYVAAEKTYEPTAGAGGVSARPSELEGTYARNWAQNIWADTLL